MLNTMFANDVRQNLEHFRRSVDELFDSFYGGQGERTTSRREGQERFSPVLESAWTDNSLHLRAIVPGVTQNEVKVTLVNDQLVIEGERKAPEGWNRNAFTQLAYGKFYTAVTLPSGLDADKMACRLHDGVLDIQIPVHEARKPRQIQIQTGDAKQISA
jgi:HSP20 family protein